jgi:DNA-binding winged helix-turn-helix (wHTH) protein
VHRPTNPYVAGAALRGENGFFGRQNKLRRVERELRNPATSALVLFGQRRIGKTSMLLQLQRTLPLRSFLPVYFDLQDQTSRPLAQVLADLADTIAERAGLEAPDADAFDDTGRFFRRTFLPQLYRVLGKDRRLILLLDEFDVLTQRVEHELPETAAARALFPFLRRVMAEDPRPAFVFVLGRQTGDLSLDFTATFRSALVQEIWVLEREAARELVLQAQTNGSLRFSEQALERILSLTSCHPYLTQLLCQRIWEQAHRDDPSAPPLIDAPEVERSIPDALEAGDQAMAWIWNGLSPTEKIYITALGEAGDEGQAIPESRVVEMLISHAARLRTRQVELAPHDLVKRRVLETDGDRKHRFTLELFRRWVRKNKPLREVKVELDRVDPVAERLYEIGRDRFKQRQWEASVRYFRDALDAHPNHFRARLHLGEALLELGQLEAAVVELERAHELDQVEAKFALARAKAQARAPADAPKLLIDDDRGNTYLGGQEIHLSRLEHHVLRCLAQQAGQVMSKKSLTQAVRAHKGFERASVDAAVYRLRKKLGDSARNPTYLETRRGQGYILHHATHIPPGEEERS